MKQKKRTKSWKKILLFLFTLNIILFLVFLLSPTSQRETELPNSSYPELNRFSGAESFEELREYFTDLANKKGAVYAYEVLQRIPTTNGVDMHLMGHTVGEILYMQKGAEGMQYCTQDFRNACSHTIVVGLFADKGEAALDEIVESCKKAPGGRGAYNMCFHGLGHGVLSFTGFDLPKTIELCSNIKKGRSDGREFPECVGGAIMEIISGGDHDKELWSKQSRFYLSTPDPLFPCTADFMPEVARSQCYVYITPHLYQVAGANLGFPQPEDFKKAFTYCDRLPISDPNRAVCYGGFGKEFVVLAAGRDIRADVLLQQSDVEFGKVYEWCKLAEWEQGIEICMTNALSSYYWGGENPYSISVNFCSSIKDNIRLRNACFDSLIAAVYSFNQDKSYIRDFCRAIPSEYQNRCNPQ